MTKKTTKTSQRRGQRNIKVGKLPKAEKPLSEDELKAVEGAGPLADFATGLAQGIEHAASTVAHSISVVAEGAAKAIKG